MSILLKFLTLKWNISKTNWHIEVGDGSFFCIFHTLSFELNFFLTRGSLEHQLQARKLEAIKDSHIYIQFSTVGIYVIL